MSRQIDFSSRQRRLYNSFVTASNSNEQLFLPYEDTQDPDLIFDSKSEISSGRKSVYGGNFQRTEVTLTVVTPTVHEAYGLGSDKSYLLQIRDRSRLTTSEDSFSLNAIPKISVRFETVIAGTVSKKIHVQIVSSDDREDILCQGELILSSEMIGDQVIVPVVLTPREKKADQ